MKILFGKLQKGYKYILIDNDGYLVCADNLTETKHQNTIENMNLFKEHVQEYNKERLEIERLLQSSKQL